MLEIHNSKSPKLIESYRKLTTATTLGFTNPNP